MSVRDVIRRGARCFRRPRRDMAEVLARLTALKIGQIALERKVDKMADTLDDVKAVADVMNVRIDALQTEVGEEIVILKDLAGKVGGAVDQAARDAIVAQLTASADRIQAATDALDAAGNEAEPPPAPPVPPTE